LNKAYLNLGCGSIFLKGWKNLDFHSFHPEVISHDLRLPLPIEEKSIDVVYHAHVLQHLEYDDAHKLMHECQRVLKPGGSLRIVVPDLESKARLYLKKLEQAENSTTAQSEVEYEWSVIELIDQLVRRKSGGRMLEFILRDDLPKLVYDRLGKEVSNIRQAEQATKTKSQPQKSRPSLRKLLKTAILHRFNIYEPDLEICRFLEMGECHLWMYDRHSLKALLQKVGMSEISTVSASSSNIPDWGENEFWLDAPGGMVRRPDSLYMEARRK